MATLQKIRDKGVLLVIVVGVALAAFVLGDLLMSGTTFMERGHTRAFVVDGNVVSIEEYHNRVALFEEIQRMLGRQLDENVTAQIREAAYQQMVRERLIGGQARRLGLTVTVAELNDLIHGTHISPILTHELPFFINPETGVFDREMLVGFHSTAHLDTQGMSAHDRAIVQQFHDLWIFIENMVALHRLEEKYMTLLTSAVMVNDVEDRKTFELSQQNADIAFAMRHFFTVPDADVTVTDREIRDFYNQHRNNFIMETPLVQISYFIREIVPSDDDFANAEAEAIRAADELATATNPAIVVSDFSETPFLNVFLNENLLTPSQVEFVRAAAIGEVQGPTRDGDMFQVYKLIDRTFAPDSVLLRAIPVQMPTAFGQDSLVLHFADSLYNAIRGGSRFIDVANSIDPHSNGGEVGTVREIDLLRFLSPDVIRTIFEAPVGQPFRASMPGQELILQVDERTRPITKHKIAIINMPVIPSERTTNNVDNELNQFLALPDVGTRFNELAAERGFMIMPSASVSASAPGLARIPGSRQVITWAANERRMGSVRRFDLPNLRIVARVDNITPAGPVPLSEVQESIRLQLLNDRKAELIINELEAQNLTSLDAFATAMHSQVDTVRFVNFATRNITGLGNEPVINAVSAFAPLNVVQGPMRGNMGVFVASVIERTQGADELDVQLQEFQRQMRANENTERLQAQSIAVLRNKLGVKDYRFRFW